MKTAQRLRIILSFLSALPTISYAQGQAVEKYIKGRFNGSFETYSQYYLKNKIVTELPQDRVGSNNFLKLDYNYGKFTAGVQFEGYLPAVLGFYPFVLEPKSKIVNKYFKYTTDKFSVQVGDFYEQFGNGMILRSYENRQIGINNAIEGANIHAEPLPFVKLKALYGRTRRFFDYTNTLVRGTDVEFDINKMVKKEDSKVSATLGGSYVGKYQAFSGGGSSDDFPSTVHAYAARMSLNAGDFNIESEYVQKDRDPHLLNNQSFDQGRAFQVDAAYTKNNFGISATFRSLYNMDFTNDRDEEFATIAPVNFIPALTKQHDYLTSNIFVYAPQFRGETGFQTDIYYTFKPGTPLGGKYGTKLSSNFSLYSGLNKNKDIFSLGRERFYRDANIEMKKKLSKSFELTVGLQQIFYNASVIQKPELGLVDAYIAGVGGLYKWAPKKSVRFKAEHLYSKENEGSWVSMLTEFSFSSPFMFFVSDLYNYGTTNIHYYNVGSSVTKNSTRFSMSYGKQRPGLLCVGGICRFVPASYGFTATLTTTFSN
ncbi:MAG: hypothetical protein RL582_1305 [Bacteroidota bacterium]